MIAQKYKNGTVRMVGAIRTGFRKPGEITIRCGQCIGCKLERSRQWAVRCMHEAALHEANCFVTLTFADQYLPEDRSLCVTHLQKFMKRLRKHFAPHKIRFYACGEYGEQYQRPHYHLCLFGIDFTDKYYWATNRGNTLYRSSTLEQLWPFGNATLGQVTFESAAYVARYVTKKITGPAAQAHYQIMDPSTGELYHRRPEFTQMSRRPGIGRNWLSRFEREVYQHDSVIMRGREMKPPRYYDLAYEIHYPGHMEQIRQQRRDQRNIKDNTRRALAAHEAIMTSQHSNATRNQL